MLDHVAMWILLILHSRLLVEKRRVTVHGKALRRWGITVLRYISLDRQDAHCGAHSGARRTGSYRLQHCAGEPKGLRLDPLAGDRMPDRGIVELS